MQIQSSCANKAFEQWTNAIFKCHGDAYLLPWSLEEISLYVYLKQMKICSNAVDYSKLEQRGRSLGGEGVSLIWKQCP